VCANSGRQKLQTTTQFPKQSLHGLRTPLNRGGPEGSRAPPRENSHRVERAPVSLENMTLDFLFLGTGMYARRELSDVIVLRSVVLVEHLNPELGVTWDFLDLPEFIPYGL